MKWTPMRLVEWLFAAVPEPDADTVDGLAPPIQEPPDDLLPGLVIGSDGWLRGDKVVVMKTKRPGYKWRTKSGSPGGLLAHWTATSHGTAKAMVKRRVELEDGGGGTVHFWIEADGTIYQSCSTLVGHGHAGGATSAKLMETGAGKIVKSPKGKHSANSFLLGCEIVNVGEVRRVDGKWMGWPFGRDGKKGPIVKDIAAWDDDKYYHRFTMAQVEAYERLVRAIVTKYGLKRAAFEWGHVDVDPTRKSDPGPIFKERILPAILDRVFA